MSRQTQKDIEELKEKAVKNAEFFYHYKLIAKSVGRDEDTLNLWRRADPDFSDKIEIGRAEFLRKNIAKAKPDFLLERLEKSIFGQKIIVEGGENPVSVLLQRYGLTGGENDRKDDGSVQESHQSNTQS